MKAKTEHYHLNSEIRLHDDSESVLTVRTVSLVLTKENDTYIDCRLTFQVSPELYQQIDNKALFNLKPEVRSPLLAGEFQPSRDIEIEASLDKDLLPKLSKNVADVSQVAAYLQKISQEQPTHPLLSAYSWYGLQVKQQREIGETGYRTLWIYLKPSAIAQDGISSEQISEAMVNFAKEWTDASQPGTLDDGISEAIENMTQVFEELADNLSEMSQNAISETLEEVTSAFEELANSVAEATQDTTSTRQILEATISFFTEDDWHFTKIKGEPVLQMVFQGEHGKWTCYAKARQEQEQFIFYSVSPVNAPENKRLAVAEFLTRANYGTIIGNFELDFASGEIRYKTSIDVKGNFLSSEALKQLVYTNVMMMDRYLPGIMAVIDQNVSTIDAMFRIEG